MLGPIVIIYINTFKYLHRQRYICACYFNAHTHNHIYIYIQTYILVVGMGTEVLCWNIANSRWQWAHAVQFSDPAALTAGGIQLAQWNLPSTFAFVWTGEKHQDLNGWSVRGNNFEIPRGTCPYCGLTWKHVFAFSEPLFYRADGSGCLFHDLAAESPRVCTRATLGQISAWKSAHLAVEKRWLAMKMRENQDYLRTRTICENETWKAVQHVKTPDSTKKHEKTRKHAQTNMKIHENPRKNTKIHENPGKHLHGPQKQSRCPTPSRHHGSPQGHGPTSEVANCIAKAAQRASRRRPKQKQSMPAPNTLKRTKTSK